LLRGHLLQNRDIAHLPSVKIVFLTLTCEMAASYVKLCSR
jgi:hypothetical protein